MRSLVLTFSLLISILAAPLAARAQSPAELQTPEEHLKFFEGMPSGIRDLYIQILAAKGVRVLLEKNPMLLMDYVRAQADYPLLTPAAVALFHSVGKGTEAAVMGRFRAKYGKAFELAESGSKALHIGGMYAGLVATDLASELLFGDITRYADAKEQIKFKNTFFGFGAGIAASEVAAEATASLIGRAGRGPVAFATFIGGVVMWVTTDYYEAWRNKANLTEYERKRLEQVIRTIPTNIAREGPAGKSTNAKLFDSQLKRLSDAFTALRKELMADVLDERISYLDAIVRERLLAYQRVQKLEWYEKGKPTTDDNYAKNPFEWREYELPLDWSIQLSLVPGGRAWRAQIKNLIQTALQERDRNVASLNAKYTELKTPKYEKLLADPRFLHSYYEELNILLPTLAGYVPNDWIKYLTAIWKLSQDPKALLGNATEIRDRSRKLMAFMLTIPDDDPNSAKIESLVSAINVAADGLFRHSKRTYFADLSVQSLTKLDELMKMRSLASPFH